MILMISNIVRDDTINKAFGFATNEEGEEFFIPRALVRRHDLVIEDIGEEFTGKVRPNPRPQEGVQNLPHVTVMTFEEEDE